MLTCRFGGHFGAHPGTLYAKLMADRANFDAIDFCNVQFYNQIPFPSADAVFVAPIYSPAEHAPTSLVRHFPAQFPPF